MTHLRRYLEEHGVLYPEQLAEAIRRQQIYGGSLDTVLLELELVDPVTLGEMLERACGFPVVPPELLENGIERPWTEIPEDLQRSRWVEPLAREGDEIVVAVHPDLPNDLLGRLLRSLRRMRPMVTPECCLEKVAAERHRSVVPQRYAVLCASYLSAVRRRPSVSGAFIAEEAGRTEPAVPSPAATPPRTVTAPAMPAVTATPPRTVTAPAMPAVTATPPRTVTAPAGVPAVTATPPSRTVTAPAGTPVVAPTVRPATAAVTPPPVRFPPGQAHDKPQVRRQLTEPYTTEPYTPEDRRSAAGSIEVVEAPPMSLPGSEPPRTGTTLVPTAPLVTPHGTVVASTAPSTARSGSNGHGAAATAPTVTPPLRAVPPPPLVPAVRDDADVRRRLEQARAVLEDARSRDDALTAIVEAAMVLSPRVGLFRARGDELVGLSTPQTALDDMGGKIVAATEGSAAGIAADRGSYSGLAPEADLRLATGASATTPCLLQRVDVRGKPVVFVYLDRDGAPIDAQDVQWIGDLAALGGRVFEEILKLRRQPGPAPAPTPPTPSATDVGRTPEAGWGPVPPRVRAAYGDGGGDEPIEPPPVEPPPSRVSTPDREHPDGRVPPPPIVPPPMPAAEPASWRLTPELAARALERGVTVEPAATSSEAALAEPEAGEAVEPEVAEASAPEGLEPSAEAPAPEADTAEPAATELVAAPQTEPSEPAAAELVAAPETEPQAFEASEPDTLDFETPASGPDTVELAPPSEAVDAAEPETHAAPEPMALEAAEPETPEVPETPEPPGVPEPETPDAPEPEPPTIPEPEVPEAPEPEPPAGPEPEVPEPPSQPEIPEPEVPEPFVPESPPEVPEPPSQPEIPEPEIPEPFVPEPSFPEVPVIGPEATAPAADRYAGAFHAGSDDVTISVPRSEITEIGIPHDDDDDDVTIVGLPLPGVEVERSERPTVELPAISEDAIPAALTRETQELVSGAPKTTEPVAERPRSLSKITMHSSPPPPPLPPPPTSAVDEGESESEPAPGGGRRVRSATIHGLPPPELKTRAGATKRIGPLGDELILGAEEEEEVKIISLAEPLMPATARGRIALEDEDWVAPGSQLASDSQQGLIDAVIDAVVAGEADVDALREHGDTALLRLVAQFPGPLEVLRRDLRALPPPSAHGPLVRTVIAVGTPVVPFLIDLFEHPNPDVRFYAAFVFHELRDARCMRPLAKLAFDANGDVRVVSMRVLETYRRQPGFEAAAAIVREQLVGDGRAQQLHAARAAGTLRDIGAIPQLIELLASSDRFIQEAALESLCSITGQQHGLKPHRWRAWYDDQGHRHRVEWIIDSLRHRDLPVRRWAADELVRITGHRVPFSPMGDKRSRDVAAKAWTDWWEARGRELFGG